MAALDEICALAEPHAGAVQQGISRFQVFSQSHTTQLMPLVYDPVISLVLQGKKRTLIGNTSLEYGPGQYIIVAAEVTAFGQVYEASENVPFVAVYLSIDSSVISALLTDMAEMKLSPHLTSGFGAGTATELELDCWKRMVDLLNRPEEVPILHSQLERELLFRLLMGSQGHVLRGMRAGDSAVAPIRKVMSWIRESYTSSLNIDVMADMAGMSLSVFYRRFKAVTGITPLQYQKNIRLHEARRRMLSEGQTAAAAGFSVGYESAPQFSREYKRLFGYPPGQDTDLLKQYLEK